MSRVPVVPTLITGTDKALPPGARWLKRAKISVEFGRPIYYTSTFGNEDLSGHGLHEAISSKIMAEIEELRNSHRDSAD